MVLTSVINRCSSSSFTQDERKINEIPSDEKEEVILSGGDGFLDADSLTLCKNAACFLYCDLADTRKNATGFFARIRIGDIDYNVIVTNNHVFSCKEEASNAVARFHYEGNIKGAEARILPHKIFQTNKDLDYTIMGCDDERILNTFLIRPIQLVDEGFVSPNEEVYIFQHPRGGKKQMSHNTISRIERPFVYYNADTDIGSSGSCVLHRVQNTFKLLAVHCKGSDALRFNKGVLCSEIIRHVNTGQYTSPKPLLPFSPTNARKISSLKIDESGGKSVESGAKRNYTYIDDSTPESPVKKKLLVDDTESPTVKKNLCNDEETEIPEKFLNDMSEQICPYWKLLGRKLEISNADIEIISRDNINYSDLQEKAVAMLMKWKEQSTTPTYSFLKEKLLDLGKRKTVKDFFHF